jgi:hypothetical protein
MTTAINTPSTEATVVFATAIMAMHAATAENAHAEALGLLADLLGTEETAILRKRLRDIEAGRLRLGGMSTTLRCQRNVIHDRLFVLAGSHLSAAEVALVHMCF